MVAFLGGALVFGSLLQSLGAATERITPAITYGSTVVILVGLAVVSAVLKRRPVWGLTKLGPTSWLSVGGVLMLLWYPRAVELQRWRYALDDQRSTSPTSTITTIPHR